MSRLGKAKAPKDSGETVAIQTPENRANVIDDIITQAVEEKPVETPQPEGDPTERTYVLRHGKDASFPLAYPNGQTVLVVFKNGMKKLSGRLSNMFHAEYMNNPMMRRQVSLSDNAIADKVAENYVKNRQTVAHPGLHSAHQDSALRESIMQDAQMRNMQKRAAAGDTVEEIIPLADIRNHLEE